MFFCSRAAGRLGLGRASGFQLRSRVREFCTVEASKEDFGFANQAV